MSVLRSIFRYKGVRIRPWMMKIPLLLYGLLLLPVWLALGFLLYIRREDVQTLNQALLLMVGAGWLLNFFLAAFLNRFLEERLLFWKKLFRMSILARYLYERGYYYEKKKKEAGKKRTIKFPRIYLKQGHYELEVMLELSGSKFQDQFLKLGGDFETTFFMDYIEDNYEEKFIVYKLAYSAYLNRIHARDVKVVKGKGLKLSKSVYWNYVENPNLLLAGGIGGGKTVFLRSLLVGAGKEGAAYLCDPKHADFVPLARLEVFKDRVFYTKEDIVAMYERFEQIMEARYAYMNQLMEERGEKELGNFEKYNLKPVFLIHDEVNSFMSSLEGNASYGLWERYRKADDNVTLKGRQAGCYIIKAFQRPSHDDLPLKIRSNMMFHVTMGRLDEYAYASMFGEENKNKNFRNVSYLAGKRVYGRGYCANFGDQAQEFYAPLIDKDFNFYDLFEKYERIENPFDPLEAGSPHQPASPVSENQILTRKEALQALQEEFSDLTDRNIRTVFDLLKDGFYPFETGETGSPVIKQKDLAAFRQVFEERERSDKSYKQIVQEQFG